MTRSFIKKNASKVAKVQYYFRRSLFLAIELLPEFVFFTELENKKSFHPTIEIVHN
jgi:hypothetical protein